MNENLINKLAMELEDYGELFINGKKCHMSAWAHDDGQLEGYMTDNNHWFASPTAAVIYTLDIVGDYVGHAQTELEYDIGG